MSSSLTKTLLDKSRLKSVNSVTIGKITDSMDIDLVSVGSPALGHISKSRGVDKERA
jgi:hypothetical protein